MPRSRHNTDYIHSNFTYLAPAVILKIRARSPKSTNPLISLALVRCVFDSAKGLGYGLLLKIFSRYTLKDGNIYPLKRKAKRGPARSSLLLP